MITIVRPCFDILSSISPTTGRRTNSIARSFGGENGTGRKIGPLSYRLRHGRPDPRRAGREARCAILTALLDRRVRRPERRPTPPRGIAVSTERGHPATAAPTVTAALPAVAAEDSGGRRG